MARIKTIGVIVSMAVLFTWANALPASKKKPPVAQHDKLADMNNIVPAQKKGNKGLEVKTNGENEVTGKKITDGGKVSCPQPWIAHNGSCYRKFEDTGRNLTQAQDVCKQHGGYLAIMDNKEEQDFLARHLSLQLEQAYYTGKKFTEYMPAVVGSRGTNSYYLGNVTVTKAEWDTTHFLHGKPVVSGGGFLLLSAVYGDASKQCFGSCLMPFICEASYHKVLAGCDASPCQNGGSCLPSPTSHDAAYTCHCPAGYVGPQCEYEANVGWHGYEQYEYRVFDDHSKNRKVASEVCKALSSYLVTFHTPHEKTFIMALLEVRKDKIGGYNTHSKWWTGGIAFNNRTYVWEENGKITKMPRYWRVWRHYIYYGAPEEPQDQYGIVLRYPISSSSTSVVYEMYYEEESALSMFICKRSI